MLLYWTHDTDRNYMDRIPGMTQVYTSVRIIGRCGPDMVKKEKPQPQPEIKCTSSILNLSLYLSIFFTSSKLEEGIFGGRVRSNSVVTWKTVHLHHSAKLFQLLVWR
jgi:hypothetical protein